MAPLAHTRDATAPGPGPCLTREHRALLQAIAREAVPDFASRLSVHAGDGTCLLTVPAEEPPARPDAAGVERGAAALPLPAAPRRLGGGDADGWGSLLAAGESGLLLPLVARDAPVGALLLARDPGRAPFGEGDAARTGGWVRQAALALDHARLLADGDAARAALREAVEDSHRSWARLRTVAAASRAAAETAFDLQAVLDATARSVARIVGDLCMVTLAPEAGERLEVRAVHHPDPEAVALLRRIVEADPPRRADGLQGQVVSTGHPLFLAEPSPQEVEAYLPASHRPFLDRFGIRSLLIVPLRARERVIGTLTVARGRHGEPYTDDDWSLLQDIADQAALAVDNARLLGAAHDELTRRIRAEAEREHLLHALELERARLAATLESLPVGLFFARAPDGRAVVANEMLERIFRQELPAAAPTWSDTALWTGFRPDGSRVAPDEWPISRALRGEVVHGDEYECHLVDGSRVWVRNDAAPVRDASGEVVGGVVVVSDIGPARRTEARLRALERRLAGVAELGLRVHRREPVAALMERAAALVAEALEAEFVAVLELLPGSRALAVRAGTGWCEGVVGTARVSAGTRAQAGFTLLHDEPVVVRDAATDRRFRPDPLLVEHGVTSGVSVAVRGVGRAPFGVLAAYTARGRDFTADEAAFLQLVAGILAQALDRRDAEAARERTGPAGLTRPGTPRA